MSIEQWSNDNDKAKLQYS